MLQAPQAMVHRDRKGADGGKVQRRQQIVDKGRPAIDQRRKEASPSPGVSLQPVSGLFYRACNLNGGPIIKWMRQGDGRNDPLYLLCGKGEAPKKQRRLRQRVDRRADIVLEAGQGKRLRAQAATRCGPRFDHQHAQALLRQRDRCRQAVGTGSNHNCFIAHRSIAS